LPPEPPWATSHQTPPATAPLSKIHSEILSTLVRRTEWRAEDLAAELYLSEGAVRSHLNVLSELGLVNVHMERNGPGRPRHLYSISSRGRATFPSGYEHWLIAILDTLSRDHGEVYGGLGDALVASGVPSATVLNEPAASRLALFRKHMSELGHQLQARELPDGEQLEVFNCGTFLAARAHPWICEAEQGWMQTHFPDREVELTQCMTGGSPTCVFALRPR